MRLSRYMRSATAAVALVIALALVPAPAMAREPHHRMTFDFSVLVARSYWAKRDVTIPCNPQAQVLTYDDTKGWDMGQAMFAGVTDCTITITPWADGLRFDQDMAWAYCQDIVHEVGHLAGLEHSEDPDSIMSADPWVVPWGCDHPRRFRQLMRVRAHPARSRLGPNMHQGAGTAGRRRS